MADGTSLDRFTDEELLVLCDLADLIADRIAATTPSLPDPATPAERGFLNIMESKELWTYG